MEDIGIDAKKILKWILKKTGVWVWAGFSWLKIIFSENIL
jgi:hypothetical protein